MRQGRGTSDAKPWEELKVKFLAIVTTSGGAPPWREVWRIFLEDLWYQRELKRHARGVLRASNAPREWLEDLQQEAMLVLAAKLSKTPDLHVDYDRVEEKFPAWIGVIALNACRTALRRFHSRYRSGVELSAEVAALDDYEKMDTRIDLNMALAKVEEPNKSVLLLVLNGYSLPKISEALDLSYWTAHGAMQRGMEQLRAELATYRVGRTSQEDPPSVEGQRRPEVG